jgi:hypothetical protein
LNEEFDKFFCSVTETVYTFEGGMCQVSRRLAQENEDVATRFLAAN